MVANCVLKPPLFPQVLKAPVKKETKKRVHYAIPTYKKVYSVYQYDRVKYAEIWKKIRALALKFNRPEIFFNVSPYRVLEHCYIKKNDKKKHLGDEHHIFRYKALHKICDEIAIEVLNGQNLLPFDGIILKKDGLNLYLNIYQEKYEWFDNKTKRYKTFQGEKMTAVQAEIEGTETLPIKVRLKIHIKLLRLLRQGFKVKRAVRIALKNCK